MRAGDREPEAAITVFPEQVWTLDEHRAQLRRFHRDGWVLGAPRALAMAPCTEWLVAPGPAPAVRASSCTAAATPRPRLAQLRAALGTEVERRADLVEEVKLLAEECSIVEAERNKIDAQLGDFMGEIGKMAANDSGIVEALRGLSTRLAPEWADRLGTAIKYHADVSTDSPNDMYGSTAEGARPPQPT